MSYPVMPHFKATKATLALGTSAVGNQSTSAESKQITRKVEARATSLDDIHNSPLLPFKKCCTPRSCLEARNPCYSDKQMQHTSLPTTNITSKSTERKTNGSTRPSSKSPWLSLFSGRGKSPNMFTTRPFCLSEKQPFKGLIVLEASNPKLGLNAAEDLAIPENVAGVVVQSNVEGRAKVIWVGSKSRYKPKSVDTADPQQISEKAPVKGLIVLQASNPKLGLKAAEGLAVPENVAGVVVQSTSVEGRPKVIWVGSNSRYRKQPSRPTESQNLFEKVSEKEEEWYHLQPNKTRQAKPTE